MRLSSMMARWGDMMTVLVMGMVVSESSMVTGERCNLGQHREMQVVLPKPSIFDQHCDALLAKMMQLRHFSVDKMQTDVTLVSN